MKNAFPFVNAVCEAIKIDFPCTIVALRPNREMPWLVKQLNR